MFQQCCLHVHVYVYAYVNIICENKNVNNILQSDIKLLHPVCVLYSSAILNRLPQYINFGVEINVPCFSSAAYMYMYMPT